MDNFLQEPRTPRNQQQQSLDSQNYTPSSFMANLTLNSTSNRAGRMKQFITSDNAHLYKPRVLSEEYLIKASQQQATQNDSNIHPNLKMCLDEKSQIKVAGRFFDNITEEDLADNDEIFDNDGIEVDEEESDEGSFLPITPERPMTTMTASPFLKTPERKPMSIAERNHCIINDLFMDEDDEEDEDDETDPVADMRTSMHHVFKQEQACKAINTFDTTHHWMQNIHRDESAPQLPVRRPGKFKEKEKDLAADKENTIPLQLRHKIANKDNKYNSKGPRSRHLHDREGDVDGDNDKPDRTPLAELSLDQFTDNNDSTEKHTKKKQSITTKDGKQVVQRKVLRTLSPTRLAPRKSSKGKEPAAA